MSLLRDSDRKLHYQDGSHRWVAPDPVLDDGWRDVVNAHLEAHRLHPDEGYMPGHGGPRRQAGRTPGRRLPGPTRTRE